MNIISAQYPIHLTTQLIDNIPFSPNAIVNSRKADVIFQQKFILEHTILL